MQRCSMVPSPGPARSASFFRVVLVVGATSLLSGCPSKEPTTRTEPDGSTVQSARAATKSPVPADEQAVLSAAIGKPAPGFELEDLNGKRVSLADFKGKRVVLEWFNPECPFVKLSHEKGSLNGLAEKYRDQDVVWLAINSAGEGRQGFGVEKNRQGVSAFGLKHPVLLDPTGRVGRAYGATNTPHMFVIDARGVLVYAGAIDNSPDAEGQSPRGGKLTNYVTQALDELADGKSISVPKTEAYGCSVKFAKS